MNTKWYLFLITMFAGFQLLASAASGGAPFPATGSGFNLGILNAWMTPTGFDPISNPLLAVVTIINQVWSYIQTFLNMLFWNYPALLYGNWLYLKILFLYPLSGAAIFSIVQMLRGYGA
jgi:hypothetical protein